MIQVKSLFYRPVLKWAGGKSKLIEQYIPYFPKVLAITTSLFWVGVQYSFIFAVLNLMLINLSPILILN